MATVTKPMALDESMNTTESTSRNIADVLAQELSGIASAITGGSDKANKTDIATVEPTNTASRAYSVGELVYVNGNLYKVIRAIASGATFTVGTNIQSANVSGAIKELGVVKKGTLTFTTGADGTWAGTVTIGGYPLNAGELLSAYLDRGSLSVVRKIEPRMYGYGGYLFICTDGSGNPIANTEVSVTCVYLKTT